MLNPIVLKLGVVKDWCYKSIEKKQNELKTYLFKLNQIQKFLNIFFYYYGFRSFFIRLFFNKNTLHIFLNKGYYLHLIQNYRDKFFIKKRKITFSANFILKLLNFFNLLKYKRYLKLKYQKFQNKYFLNDLNFKFNFTIKRLYFVNFVDYLKKKLYSKKVLTLSDLFLKKCFITLNVFLNSRTSIYLTIKYLLKPNLITYYLKKFKNNISFNLIKLKKFENYFYFSTSFNWFLQYLLFNQNFAYNLSKLIQFYVEQLSNFKFLNSLLYFVTNLINFFLINNVLKGIRIEIKGILGKTARSKVKVLKLGQFVSYVKIFSKLDFYHSVIFTKKGTFGLKITTF